MAVWEYKVRESASFGGKPKADGLEKALNKYGNDGWELTVFLLGNPNEGRSDLWVFKRPMPVKSVR